jgi:hypothetical protein
MSIKATVIEKRVPLSLHDIVKFQISHHCFLNNIKIAPNELTCLAYLGEWGEMNFTDFCEQIVDTELYSNPQTVRNAMLKYIRTGLVLRKGKANKIVTISDSIGVLNEGNIIIKMQVYHVEE